MALVGAALVVAAGELAKHLIPPEALYFLVINRVYFLAAASFLLLLGINKIHLNSVRNLAALFVAIVVCLVLLWQLDKVASNLLWNGTYPSVYGRIPEKYVTLFLQSLDVIAILVGAVGGFLVLLKGLDKVKDLLSGTSKT